MKKNKEIWITKNGRRFKILKNNKTKEKATKYINRKRQELKEKVSCNVKLNHELGPEYKGYKGKKAIDKLLKEKKGHIKGAFHRDDIGDIDLIWGDDKMGLKHIIKRRKETGQNVEKVLNNMANTIEKGKLVSSKRKDENKKYTIEDKENRYVIGTKLYNNKRNFILTAYEKKIKALGN